jgi:hypothetical protein
MAFLLFVNGKSNSGKTYFMAGSGIPTISTSQYLDYVTAKTVKTLVNCNESADDLVRIFQTKNEPALTALGVEVTCRRLKVLMAEQFIVPAFTRRSFVRQAWSHSLGKLGRFSYNSEPVFFVEYFNLEEYEYHLEAGNHFFSHPKVITIEVVSNLSLSECPKEVVAGSIPFYNNYHKATPKEFQKFILNTLDKF